VNVESSSVQFGRKVIPFQVQRSTRRRTVAITVDPAGGVLLTAPADTSIARLDDVVHSKATWILERLRRVGRVEPAPPAREFVSGESFRYLGRQYRLKVVRRAEAVAARLERGWLVVPIARGADQGAAVRAALVDWYMAHARRRLPERVELWHTKVGVELPRVVVRAQKKRWGSCDAKGNLRLNWRIIQAPMRLVDYVIVHELAHRVEENHTPAFWALVGRVLPDADKRREALRQLGAKLEW